MIDRIIDDIDQNKTFLMLADKEIKKNGNDCENTAGRFDGFRSYNQIASGTYPHNKNIEYD